MAKNAFHARSFL